VKLREAIPTAHVRATGFVTRSRGCALEDIRRPLYDVVPEASAFRALRVKSRIGLSVAANRIGIRAIELADLERGKLVPADSKRWGQMMVAIQRS
jgi:hypothetical protein